MDEIRGTQALLTPKAQSYLRQNNVKSLYLESVDIQKCCVPLMALPAIHKGIPSNAERFIPLTFEDFTIYYEKVLQGPPVFTVDLQGIGFIKNLVLKDWKITI